MFQVVQVPSTVWSFLALKFIPGPGKYRCLVVPPSRSVSAWTIWSHSTAWPRKVPGRQHVPCVIRMR